MKLIKLGKKLIGEKQKTFITFEAGPTHNGYSSAKKLIESAAKSGADAIKFQIIDADRLMADKNVLFEYKVLDKNQSITKKDPLYDLLKKRMLTRKEWTNLKKIADSLGICFFATIGFKEEIDFVCEIGCQSIKIASSDVNHIDLIKYASKKKINIQIDTGNSSISEIETAVNVIESTGNKNIVIHHCPSGYPAKVNNINLNIIKTLNQMFPYPIGFSDHSPGIDMDIAAISMGASLIEKTITENKKTKSVEHMFSIETKDCKGFVEKIRFMENAFGNSRRKFTAQELKNRKNVRRSPYVKTTAQINTPLKNLEVEFKRPAFGLSLSEFNNSKAKKLNKKLEAGSVITKGDIS